MADVIVLSPRQPTRHAGGEDGILCATHHTISVWLSSECKSPHAIDERSNAKSELRAEITSRILRPKTMQLSYTNIRVRSSDLVCGVHRASRERLDVIGW